MDTANKRTAREIKVKETLINNKNINVKIGTVENRDSPETVYIFISFWAKAFGELSNMNQEQLKRFIYKELENVYRFDVKKMLSDNKYFNDDEDTIYIMNVPENINYNNKRNFISIELYLHTLNVKKENNYPLSNKKNTELFDECVKITNKIGDSEILSKNENFKIFQKSM